MQITQCNSQGEIKQHVSLGAMLAELNCIREVNGFLWIDVEAPTAEEMQKIAEACSIHHVTAEDALDRRTPVKLEETDTYLFIVAHVLNLNPDSDQLETLNLSLVLFSNFCLTIHSCPVRSVGVAMKRYKRQASKGFSGPERALYLVLQAMTEFYAELVDKGSDEVDEIEDAVIGGDVDAHLLQRISTVGRQISVVRRRLGPTGRMLEQLCSDDVERIDTNSHVYLRDALNGVTRLLEKSLVMREILNTTQANYLAQVSNQMNVVMKTLSLVATVMMPLSFLTGLFGMNVRVPGQATESLIWFICLLAVMAGFGGVLLLLFRRKGWF